MKQNILDVLSPLLNFLRSYEVLDEAAGCKFLLKGQDFIHFHDHSDGLWADAKLSKGRIRLSVATPSGQRELMEMVSATLDSLESDGKKREGRKNKRKKTQRI
jgi:RNA recognition motif-containing protein